VFSFILALFHERTAQTFRVWKTTSRTVLFAWIFQRLRGFNCKYRSKQNTDMSTSWLFIDHNSRDLIQTTTAAKKSQNKGFNESYNGSARVINLTFLSQPMQNKQVHHRGIIFKNAFFTNLAVASIYRHISGKILKYFNFRIRVAVILAWDVQLAVIAAKRTSAE